MRLKLPANYRIPAHWHPADEHVTVISGTFNMGTGDVLDTTTGKTLPAGSFALMPAQMHHFAWTSEETVLQLHGVGPWQIHYINPADDPRTQQ
jgi:quercetin dioxygenase-like cupin family protein